MSLVEKCHVTAVQPPLVNPRRFIDRWKLKVHVKLTFLMYFAFDAYRFLIPKIAGDIDKFCLLLLRPGQMSHTIFNQFQN